MSKQKFLVMVECTVEADTAEEATKMVATHLLTASEPPEAVLRIVANKAHRIYASNKEMFDEINQELKANPTPSSASGGC